MAEPVRINLWEVLTSIEGRAIHNSDKAAAVVAQASKTQSFGSELDFEIDQMGNWIVRIFSHEDPTGHCVTLRVDRFGSVIVTRNRNLAEDVSESREVKF